MNSNWFGRSHPDGEVWVYPMGVKAGTVAGTVAFDKTRPQLLYVASVQDQRKRTERIGSFNTKQAAMNAVEAKIKSMIKQL